MISLKNSEESILLKKELAIKKKKFSKQILASGTQFYNQDLTHSIYWISIHNLIIMQQFYQSVKKKLMS